VLQKLLLYSAVSLTILKFVFKLTPKELARRVDRFVNPAIVFLLVSYGAYFLWWLFKGR
jgi:hypothetical protein